MRVPSLILASVVLLGCATPNGDAEEPDYATDYSYTEETKWSIFTTDGRLPLRTMLPHLALPYVFGMYIEPYAYTVGNRLYLFPTFEYAVTSWCDVCEERTLELGTWTFAEGLVKLSPTLSSTQEEFQDLDFFRRGVGDFHTLRLFVIAEEGEYVGDSVLVTPERLDAGPPDHVDGMIRQREYPDWPDTLRQLRQQFP